MWKRITQLVSVSALFVVPVTGQFGVAGNRRQQGAAGTKFQDLQERAKKAADGAAAGGDMEDLAKMFGDTFNDPEVMKQYEAAMAELAKMDPEQLQQQMAQAMDIMTKGDALGEVLKEKDAVIANLESTNAIPADELARMKTDDAYFELKMRESFQEMQKVFNDPEYMEMATKAMGDVAGMLSNPEKAFEGLASALGEIAEDDGKIEEARLQFLEGDFAEIPMLAEAFKSEEMQEVLLDPVKFKNAVKEGYQAMLTPGAGAAAGDASKEEL